MNEYFYYPFLPKDFGSLSKSKKNVISEKLAKYLYITTLSRILMSLEESNQLEFISTLESSENEASVWIRDNEIIRDVVKEHLERTLLSLRAQQ